MVTVDMLREMIDPDIRVGVTTTEPFTEVASEIHKRVADGHHGGLGFTYRDPDTSTDPRISFPWAASIVVAAVPYLIDGDGVDTEPRRVARFAAGDRYARVRETLNRLASIFDDTGHRWEAVFDDDRLVDRAVAVRAGIAWSGKSTMALTPGHGPWFLIGSIVTDARIDPTPPMVRGCGTCTACMPACPTGAIVAPGVLDASRCLAAVLQRPGSIPIELREAVGRRIYGCDECLVACPPGDHALESVSRGERSPDAVDVLAMSDEEIDRLAGHWYVPKRSMRYVRRNAIVAVGNAAEARTSPMLAGYLGHPDSLLRGHAAWALGMLGTPEADAILIVAAEDESDSDVLSEIARALTIRTATVAKTSENGSVSVYADDESDAGRNQPEGSHQP